MLKLTFSHLCPSRSLNRAHFALLSFNTKCLHNRKTRTRKDGGGVCIGVGGGWFWMRVNGSVRGLCSWIWYNVIIWSQTVLLRMLLVSTTVHHEHVHMQFICNQEECDRFYTVLCRLSTHTHTLLWKCNITEIHNHHHMFKCNKDYSNCQITYRIALRWAEQFKHSLYVYLWYTCLAPLFVSGSAIWKCTWNLPANNIHHVLFNGHLLHPPIKSSCNIAMRTRSISGKSSTIPHEWIN